MTTQTEHAVKCPELEELAAFIDGKLSGAGRDAVVEHLASCEACYEVYTETLRIQEDLGPRAVAAAGEDDESGELAPVVRHPRSFGWAWRAAAAMAAGLVLAVGFLWHFSFSPPPAVTGMSTIVSTRTDLEGEDFSHRWTTFRGSVPPPALSSDRDPRERAFRLGVHAIDLEAALRIEDRDQASAQTSRIQTLLEETIFTSFYSREWGEFSERISADAPTAELLKASSERMDRLVEDDGPLVDDQFFFSFGKWTEKSRLAALTGAKHYFGEGGLGGFLRRLKGDDEFRGFLRRLEKADLGERVSKEVEKIRELVASESIPQEELINALEEIIRLEGVR